MQSDAISIINMKKADETVYKLPPEDHSKCYTNVFGHVLRVRRERSGHFVVNMTFGYPQSKGPPDCSPYFRTKIV